MRASRRVEVEDGHAAHVAAREAAKAARKKQRTLGKKAARGM